MNYHDDTKSTWTKTQRRAKCSPIQEVHFNETKTYWWSSCSFNWLSLRPLVSSKIATMRAYGIQRGTILVPYWTPTANWILRFLSYARSFPFFFLSELSKINQRFQVFPTTSCSCVSYECRERLHHLHIERRECMCCL